MVFESLGLGLPSEPSSGLRMTPVSAVPESRLPYALAELPCGRVAAVVVGVAAVVMEAAFSGDRLSLRAWSSSQPGFVVLQLLHISEQLCISEVIPATLSQL